MTAHTPTTMSSTKAYRASPATPPSSAQSKTVSPLALIVLAVAQNFPHLEPLAIVTISFALVSST